MRGVAVLNSIVITGLQQEEMYRLAAHNMCRLAAHNMCRRPAHNMCRLAAHNMCRLPAHNMCRLARHNMCRLAPHNMCRLAAHNMCRLAAHNNNTATAPVNFTQRRAASLRANRVTLVRPCLTTTPVWRQHTTRHVTTGSCSELLSLASQRALTSLQNASCRRLLMTKPRNCFQFISGSLPTILCDLTRRFCAMWPTVLTANTSERSMHRKWS